LSAAAEQRWNEAALARPVAAPAWRLTAYERAAVVLGRAQRDLLAGAAAAAAPAGLEVLLRGAGGGAVLVGPWMIGLSVALPPAHALVGPGPVASYRWLGEGIAEVLQGLGVARAQALSPEALRAQGAPSAPDWACFGGLSPWEVVAGGRKIAGLAQVRRRSGVLLVGGVLVDDPPWERLCEALARPPAEAERLRRATTSGAAEAAAASATLAPALTEALTRMLQERLNPRAPAAPAG